MAWEFCTAVRSVVLVGFYPTWGINTISRQADAKNPRILDMCVICGTDPASQRWHNLGVTKFLNSTDKMLSLLVASGYTNHIRDILSQFLFAAL